MRRGLVIVLALSLAFILASCATVSGPRVAAFDASATSITAGTGVTLSWSVTGNGPIDLTLNPGIGNVTGVNSVTVYPTQTTTYTLTANNSEGTATASTTVTVTASSPPPTSDPFNITLHYDSSVTSTEQAAFNAAASRWESIITQGLPNVDVNIPQGFCGSSGTAAPAMPTSTISGTIDDLRIDVWIGSIDGAGNILGEGGPCYTRSGDHLTDYGYIELDSADVANLEQNGMLEDTILHEMGHVLGFGTLWNYYRSLLTGTNTNDPTFVGANAVREWHALGGSGNVPVENCLDSSGNPISGCGAGTIDSHWREAVFGNELMTGWLSLSGNPLSRMTIGSIQDLGYTVNYAAADPYSVPAGGLSAQSLQSLHSENFILITPKGSGP